MSNIQKETTIKKEREMLNKLKRGEENLKDGKVYSARTVFRELRDKYGY